MQNLEPQRETKKATDRIRNTINIKANWVRNEETTIKSRQGISQMTEANYRGSNNTDQITQIGQSAVNVTNYSFSAET